MILSEGPVHHNSSAWIDVNGNYKPSDTLIPLNVVFFVL